MPRRPGHVPNPAGPPAYARYGAPGGPAGGLSPYTVRLIRDNGVRALELRSHLLRTALAIAEELEHASDPGDIDRRARTLLDLLGAYPSLVSHIAAAEDRAFGRATETLSLLREGEADAPDVDIRRLAMAMMVLLDAARAPGGDDEATPAIDVTPDLDSDPNPDPDPDPDPDWGEL